MDWQQGLQDAWASVARLVPKLVAFLVILIIGLIVARLLAKLVKRLLERIGFDRWVERGGFHRAMEGSRFDASGILATIVFWAVALFTLQLAFGVFGPNPISELLRSIIAYLPNVFAAVLIIVIAGAIARAVTDLLESALSGATFGRPLAAGAGVAIMVIGIFAALDQLNIAPQIITGLWYAILAILVGTVVIALGIGGIPVARRYLERAAGQADTRTTPHRPGPEPGRGPLR